MRNKLSQEKADKLNFKGPIGKRVLYFDELTSTFDKIREMNPEEGLTVVCSRQTAGSGRLGRRWESPEGGLYLTFALTPPFNGFDIPFITTLCALGVQKALVKYADCKIKWPNDIVCGSKKLCGILTRNIVSEGKINTVLVGIGINANNTEFPPELCHAVSLRSITGKEADETLLLEEVLNSINHIYENMSSAETLAGYKEACVNLQREVTIHYVDGRENAEGICTDVLPDGSMDVKTPEGTINVNSGEVSVKGIYGFERNDT